MLNVVMSRGIASSEQFSHSLISEYIFLRCSRMSPMAVSNETIIAKCIASYTTRRAEEGVTIDR